LGLPRYLRASASGRPGFYPCRTTSTPKDPKWHRRSLRHSSRRQLRHHSGTRERGQQTQSTRPP